MPDNKNNAILVLTEKKALEPRIIPTPFCHHSSTDFIVAGSTVRNVKLQMCTEKTKKTLRMKIKTFQTTWKFLPT